MYSRQAGMKAAARSAYREAAGHFEQALGAVSHLPDQREMREQAIDLRFALRSALLPSGDFARMLTCLREAEALAHSLDDQRRLGQISRLLSLHFWFMGAHDQSLAAGQRAVGTAGVDVVPRALANLNIGFAYQSMGKYALAIECFEQTRASIDWEQRHERFGQVNLPAVMCRSWAAWGHAELGTFDEGRRLGEEALQIAEAVAHPSSLMVATWGLGRLLIGQGNVPAALRVLERSLTICQEADLPLWLPMVAPALGRAFTLGGRVNDAMTLLRRALDRTVSMGTAAFQVLCGVSLGEAHLSAGQIDEAQTLGEQALASASEHGERGNQAYALRLLGEIAAQRDPPSTEMAEGFYRRALILAEEMGMRPLQAHCHGALSVLYVQTSNTDRARAEFAAAVALYRAMNMTLWCSEG